MKELSYKLLPIEIEALLSKDWNALSAKGIQLVRNYQNILKKSKTFPAYFHTELISKKTELKWHILLIYPNSTGYVHSFYTTYSNEYGKQCVCTIDPTRCSRLTAHYIARFKSRCLAPNHLDQTIEGMMVQHCCLSIGLGLVLQHHKNIKLIPHNKYGLSIVEEAGNRLTTYITFVNSDMLNKMQKSVMKLPQILNTHLDPNRMEVEFTEVEKELDARICLHEMPKPFRKKPADEHQFKAASLFNKLHEQKVREEQEQKKQTREMANKPLFALFHIDEEKIKKTIEQLSSKK